MIVLRGMIWTLGGERRGGWRWHRLDRPCSEGDQSNARDQHRQNCGYENTVECSRPTDRSDRCTETLNPVEIEQIGADQGSEATADIGERRGVLARKYQGHDCRRNGWNEDRQRDAEAGNRLRQPMTKRRNASSG